MSQPPLNPAVIPPDVVSVKSDVQDGTPVFTGTKVPIQTLLDYRDGQSPLYEFLLDFPEVQHSQAKKFLCWWAELEKAQGPHALESLLGLKTSRRSEAK